MFGRTSLRIGRLFGIEIGLDFSWFLIAFILVIHLRTPVIDTFGPGGATLFAVILAFLFFGSILAHELGHALTARAFGVETQKIILHLFGGVALLNSEPRRPRDEFWITAAGPAVSFLLCILFGTVAVGLGLMATASPSQAIQAFLMICTYVAFMNGILAVFNCLPGFPMDGGRIVRAAVWAATGSYVKATRLASWGGVGVGVLLMLWGIAGMLTRSAGIAIPVVNMGGLLMVFLGPFLIYLARVSRRQAEVVAAFEGLTVGDLMRPVRAVIPADMLLSDVVEYYFRQFQADQFPVVDGHRLVGALTRESVNQVERRQWDWMRAGELAQPFVNGEVLQVDMEAFPALQMLVQQNRACQAVFEGRRLRGYLFTGDLVQRLQGGQAR